MDPLLDRAVRIAADHPSPALPVRELLRLLQGSGVSVSPAALDRALLRAGGRLRVVDPWQGPWATVRKPGGRRGLPPGGALRRGVGATSAAGARAGIGAAGAFGGVGGSGDSGDRGASDRRGASGRRGAPGAPGTQGAPGATGVSRAAGASGPSGAYGGPAASGRQGASGASGAPGASGPAGMSGGAAVAVGDGPLVVAMTPSDRDSRASPWSADPLERLRATVAWLGWSVDGESVRDVTRWCALVREAERARRRWSDTAGGGGRG